MGGRRDRDEPSELLETTWSTERAEDRLMFLDSLRTGLGADDEPFLERALTDRSRNVRSTAAELLSALPGSALATRMADRVAEVDAPARHSRQELLPEGIAERPEEILHPRIGRRRGGMQCVFGRCSGTCCITR